MALYAEIRKVEEDEQQVRYAYTDVSGVERTLRLDKLAETIRLETSADDILFREVAAKVASAWLEGKRAPDRLIVQS
ncbi:hypothetical protein [Nocardia pneumoniae]|uniref:hypothetical protein n=1 Tax=Nocardia pneumoniae TaxID=228601 RepID=UPI0012F6FDD5|nr:hypothetical protein [Nocardia pneumoniae]